MQDTPTADLKEVLIEKKRLEHGGSLHWFHWLIILSSLVLTFGAWYLTKTQVESKAKNQFERYASNAVELISERMGKYEDALWGGVAAIHSQSHGIDYNEWQRFAKTLQIDIKYPGINGIGVIYNISPEEKESFLAEQRKGRPNFNIHPEHNEQELFPITYIEPVETNAAAVGLDIAHEINRYTAAKKARETGKAHITGPITLVQDAQKTPGFLFYAPFYDAISYKTKDERSKNFIGLVYAPFIFKNLMRGTLESDKRLVGIKISDDDTVLFDENHEGVENFDPNPLFKKKVTVNMYGRNWNFEIWSKLSFKAANTNNKPWMILIGGLIIDAFLLGLFIFLARANRNAIDFAGRMTEGYQIQAEHLTRSNEELERFAYVASHDLQEPLRMVVNFTKLLEQKYGKKLDDQALEYIAFASDGAIRMQELIDDLLEYSRLDEEASRTEPTDLNDTMEIIRQNLQESIEHSGAQITTQNLPVVLANPIRIMRVLQNLVGNALKYQKADNTPKIHISAEEKDGAWLISVKDNGIGMKQEYCDKIFEPFKRLHGKEEYMGTGMGLAICRKIIEFKDGKIWAESELDKGSTFYFTLPILDPELHTQKEAK